MNHLDYETPRTGGRLSSDGFVVRTVAVVTSAIVVLVLLYWLLILFLYYGGWID